MIAGGYFFKYSVHHELISTRMRVVLGTLAGVGCVGAAEIWLRRRHELLANCIAGTGIALSYLSSWAALARYQLIGTAAAAGSMIVVTVVCCVLSVKRRSRAIAVFGLAGGFATPIMLSTGSDRPYALFTYLLLLDLALLAILAVPARPCRAATALALSRRGPRGADLLSAVRRPAR